MADQTAVNNALGTILGYLGAEIAPPDLFERLLWPQRFYNGFSLASIPKMALLMTMGGPLHRAALTTFDDILHNDLLKGPHVGHMLGSPFYKDSCLKYTVYDAEGRKEGEEYVRNDLWTRVAANYPIPSSALSAGGDGKPTVTRVRAFHKVSYLRLSAICQPSQPRGIANEETGAATACIYVALFVTELVSVIIGAIVLATWRSLFGLLWFIPLILKLASAAFALQREPIKVPELPTSPPRTPSVSSTSGLCEKPESPCPTPSSTDTLAEPTQTKIFEIHNEKHGFLLIEGPEELVLQFFRHYGHPIRNRYREAVQLCIIICMGFVFPVGLVCCLVWMPVSLQYLWLGYQLYTTLAMHIYRFTGGRAWSTTEDHLLKQFLRSSEKGEPQVAYLGGPGRGVMAELNVTFHGRYAEGKAHMERLLLSRANGGC